MSKGLVSTYFYNCLKTYRPSKFLNSHTKISKIFIMIFSIHYRSTFYSYTVYDARAFQDRLPTRSEELSFSEQISREMPKLDLQNVLLETTFPVERTVLRQNNQTPHFLKENKVQHKNNTKHHSTAAKPIAIKSFQAVNIFIRIDIVTPF